MLPLSSLQVFPKLLMQAHQHITSNPEEADYFFPHIFLFSNNWGPEPHDVIKMMRAVRFSFE